MSKPEVTWTTVTKKIGDLKEYPDNPRKMSKDEFNELVKSLSQDGYHGRLLVNTDDTIIGGHGRRKALLSVGYTKNDEIEVLIPSRKLEKDDFDRVNIRDNLSFGGWDYDMLGNLHEPQKLIDWGMPPAMLGQTHYELNEDEESDKIKETKPKNCPHCGELLN